MTQKWTVFAKALSPHPSQQRQPNLLGTTKTVVAWESSTRWYRLPFLLPLLLGLLFSLECTTKTFIGIQDYSLPGEASRLVWYSAIALPLSKMHK